MSRITAFNRARDQAIQGAIREWADQNSIKVTQEQVFRLIDKLFARVCAKCLDSEFKEDDND